MQSPKELGIVEESYGGGTYYLDQGRTWNLAAVAFYETHTSKDGTDQKVGDILTVEGGLGRTFAKGSINVGLAYYGQWKMTDDDLGLEVSQSLESTLPLRDLSRHQILGAGPEISFPLASKKKLYGSVTLRYYWDFAVESNAEAQTFVFNLSVPVPFIDLGEG